jgi:hypothetical protein
MLLGSGAHAECVALIKGAIAMDVNSCGLLNPEASFTTSNSRYKFIGDLPAAERKKFYDSYRGLILKGKVVKSLAVKSGLIAEKGALNGENVSVFVPPGSALSCSEIDGARVAGNVDEACCEGGGDVPCLLDSALVLNDLKKIGEAGSRAGDKSRKVAKNNKHYREGARAYSEKKYALAVQKFEKAKAENALDIRGKFVLAMAHRALDQCPKAIPVLEEIHKAYEKNDFWADEAKVIDEANFLLARCYAKMNDPAAATAILNNYILDPKKYKHRLRQALNHRDFGWIHTSKPYLDFKKEAERILGSKG